MWESVLPPRKILILILPSLHLRFIQHCQQLVRGSPKHVLVSTAAELQRPHRQCIHHRIRPSTRLQPPSRLPSPLEGLLLWHQSPKIEEQHADLLEDRDPPILLSPAAAAWGVWWGGWNPQPQSNYSYSGDGIRGGHYLLKTVLTRQWRCRSTSRM